ncbi:STAS domain protein [Leptospira fainei serovar Hurstbridge str. BUT 6]|uniref:STAS domain protein n=1 Tax=Leptospira fainei serovar Hurstbridge str. BUT 6 TaxID=1193011 RepID=S3V6K8_9LEPT|nr:STAS domain-containing protein [Leptospira fainei]EPG76309.1 STAS domain protein [Leptospira fainei serovar Hurstbridge str. BUT 6]
MSEKNKIVITLNYEVLNADHEDLRAFLNSHLEGSPTHVVLDLKEVQVLTSIALGALVAFANRLRSQGMKLETINVSPKLLEIIKLVSLDQALGIQ